MLKLEDRIVTAKEIAEMDTEQIKMLFSEIEILWQAQYVLAHCKQESFHYVLTQLSNF
jgi:hypothetical protein